MKGKTDLMNIAAAMGFGVLGVLILAYFSAKFRSFIVTGKGGGA